MVIQQLQTLRTAFENDDSERVVEVSAEVQEAFGESRTRENAFEQLARQVDDPEYTSSQREAAAQLAQQIMNVRGARLRTNLAIRTYVHGSDDIDHAAYVDQAIESYETYQQRVDEFESVTEDVSLPALATVDLDSSIPVGKGAEFEEPVTVTNAGESPVPDVSLALESDADLDLTVTNVGTLDPGASETVSLTGSISESGSYPVKVTAEGPDDTDHARGQVEVLDKKAYVERVLEELRDLYVQTKKAISRGDGNGRDDGRGNGGNGGGGPGNGLVNKLEEITKRIVAIVDSVIEGNDPERVIDNRIDSVVNQFDAFINQVEAKRGKGLRSSDATQVVNEAKVVKYSLDGATDAAI